MKATWLVNYLAGITSLSRTEPIRPWIMSWAWQQAYNTPGQFQESSSWKLLDKIFLPLFHHVLSQDGSVSEFPGEVLQCTQQARKCCYTLCFETSSFAGTKPKHKY
jgi:hypothetical protein